MSGKQIFVPLWQACSRCGYIQHCTDPFAPGNVCPHPQQAAAAPPQEHPVAITFDLNPDYQEALAADPRFASIYERARRKLPVPQTDFLYLQALIFSQPDNPLSPATQLLWDTLREPLDRLGKDFVDYYELDPGKVDAALLDAFLWTIVHTTPDVLLASRERGLDWAVHLQDVVRLHLWAHLVRGFVDVGQEPLEDDAFRQQFEEEWQILLVYRGARFDFRVVPLLSPHAFVRYQSLPRGDPAIRRMVGTYIVHQATAYPHLPNAFWPDIHQQFYRQYLRRIYTPLVQKVARQVLESIAQTKSEQKRLKADVTQHVWQAYEDALDRFRFHVPYSGEPSPWGLLGVLGLAESEQERASFDAYLSEGGTEMLHFPPETTSTDLTPVVFSHYLEQHLKAWRLEHYPPRHKEEHAEGISLQSLDAPAFSGDDDPATTLSEQVAGEAGSGWQVDPDALPEEKPIVVGPDGVPYWSIEQVGRRHRASVSQLRYLEEKDLYRPKRAREVPGACPPLGKTMRLYPATEETQREIQTALARVATRSSALAGQEMTREVAATFLKVPMSQLRSWERAGKLTPLRRGRAVVYTPECLEKARQLLGKKANNR